MKNPNALVRGFAFLLSLGFTQTAPAQANPAVPYPVSRVTLVTHSTPGAGSDIFLRDLAKSLAPIMGVNLVVENVTGAGGTKAMAQVARAKPDGSVFYATTPTHVQVSLLSKPEVGYDKLEPLAIVFEDPAVIFTRGDAPWKTIKEVVDHARANPGKARWGGSTPASLERLTLARLAQQLGLKVPVVPHEGGGDMMINVLNGTLDIGIGEMQELRSQAEAGKIRLLAAVTEKRLPQQPNLPTLKEQGMDLVVHKFRGLSGPKGTPENVVKAWEEGLRKSWRIPPYKEKYLKNDLVPALRSQKESMAFMDKFAAETADTLKAQGLIK
jgi:tripartite-type tricarboxylate transporter receptor subunit TctC